MFEDNEPKLYYLWDTTTSSYLNKEAMQIQRFTPYNRDPEKAKPMEALLISWVKYMNLRQWCEKSEAYGIISTLINKYKRAGLNLE